MTAAELCNYYTAQGLVPTGYEIHYGEMKEFYGDKTILVSEYGGLPPEPNTGDASNSGKAIRLESPSLQIVVRGARDDYDDPRAVSEALYTANAGILNTTISSVFYLEAEPVQPPFFLKTDENFRSYIVFNIRVTKEPSA